MRRELAVVLFALLAGAPAANAQATPPPRPPDTPLPAATAQASAPGEVLAEVRIHGNYATPDAEVLRLAGLAVGQPLDATTVRDVDQRLRRSGRFEEVEIRKRYRSLEPGGDVALVIIVREHPVPEQATPVPVPLRPLRRLMASGMFMPILHYTDGYGFTYGARFSFVDTMGRGGRISVPLTWGGTKRVAVELEKAMPRGPVDRVRGGVEISRRTNPFYDLDEDRRSVWVEAGRQFAGHLRAAGHGAFARVTFGSLEENIGSYGADITLDTRNDPVFPRNAVFATAGWERLKPSAGRAVNRFRAEARGYRGLIRQAVMSLRVQYVGADGPLPPYERALLGGAGNLRGYRAGSISGDNLAGASIELRVPLSSPLEVGRLGVSVFTDVATTWNDGEELAHARFRRGAGAGVFLLASLFQLNLDVGVREGGGVHVHFSTGLQF